ncbi:hypothetical protein K504DRAFT_460252 [Pleomassaria siparia CBS 279.74]|uniref:Uncharacterized protein n=1 Tax=Pleomassaria siparia CBS 279.74 TaxID=1314801 RepID=A0A6G1JZD0_9PLEO|nr:hypothetical protein K504DRAFT_460252 [Pleomassaria siparia CBS 279.74]
MSLSASTVESTPTKIDPTFQPSQEFAAEVKALKAFYKTAYPDILTPENADELKQLFDAHELACHTYLEQLIELCLADMNPELPPYKTMSNDMDRNQYKAAQNSLTQRLTEKYAELGQAPPAGLMPELVLNEFSAAMERNNRLLLVEGTEPTVTELAFDHCGDVQSRTTGRNGKWLYKIKCGPKLCHSTEEEECSHGRIQWGDGDCPPGTTPGQWGYKPAAWKHALGWVNGFNPYMGKYEPPANDPIPGGEDTEMDMS